RCFTRNNGHASLTGDGTCGDFRTQALDDGCRRPNERDARVLTRRRELRVLREKSVAGMNRIGARFTRRIQNGRYRKITFSRRRWPDADSDIGEKHVRRSGIRIRIDGDGWNSELTAGPNDADGYLAAVGDQNPTQRLTHELRLTFQFAFRFSRNARSPSCPSLETLCAAIASAVSPAASDAPRAQTRGMRAFAVAMASGAPLRNSFTYMRVMVSSSLVGTTA